MQDILNIIATGSKGNAYIYNKDLLIDIGVSYDKINDYKNDIKLIMLTHIHSDHIKIKTLKKFLYEKPNTIVLCPNYLVDYLIEKGIKNKNIYVIHYNKQYDLGKYIIEPVFAPHDVENVGYKIIIKSNNYKIFHITDVCSLEHIQAKNYDFYGIEANYIEEELQARKEQKLLNGEYEIESRIQNTHLSYGQYVDFILQNASETSECIELHKHIERS